MKELKVIERDLPSKLDEAIKELCQRYTLNIDKDKFLRVFREKKLLDRELVLEVKLGTKRGIVMVLPLFCKLNQSFSVVFTPVFEVELDTGEREALAKAFERFEQKMVELLRFIEELKEELAH